ncbi:MAG TPA: sulfurtransferase [Candidatus Acidoferrales bacterium]|nr:sulfurtransferase [Candidatus Acidoferrales bacterium]
MVSLMLDCHDLAARLASNPRPLLLDVRWALGGPPGLGEYRIAHIPGAQFVDLDRDLSAPPGAGRHPLPDAASFEAAMRRHGVSMSRPVVVYDASTGTSAARAWWLLRYFGHPDVALLDGGFAAWTASGLPVAEGDDAGVPAGDFVAAPGALPLLDAAGAAAMAARGVLVDARAPERFRGDVEPVDPVAGHIPGARNLPAQQTLGADGKLLPPEALRDRFAAVGVRAGDPVGVYCGSGVVATQEVFAMAVAGIEAALYPGSWSEWITDPSRPIEKGT